MTSPPNDLKTVQGIFLGAFLGLVLWGVIAAVVYVRR